MPLCCGQDIINTTTTTAVPTGTCCLRTRYTCDCVDGVDTWVLDVATTDCINNNLCIDGSSCSDTEFVQEQIDGCICGDPLPALPVPTCDPACCSSTTSTTSTSSTSTTTTTTSSTTTTAPPPTPYVLWNFDQPGDNFGIGSFVPLNFNGANWPNLTPTSGGPSGWHSVAGVSGLGLGHDPVTTLPTVGSVSGSTFPADSVSIAGWMNNCGAGGGNLNTVIRLNSSGVAVAAISASRVASDVRFFGSGMALQSFPSVTGVWKHYALVIRGAIADCYIDGVKVASVAATGVFGNTATDVTVGIGLADLSVSSPESEVDQFRVYQGQLSDADVLALYLSGT